MGLRVCLHSGDVRRILDPFPASCVRMLLWYYFGVFRFFACIPCYASISRAHFLYQAFLRPPELFCTPRK